MASLSLITAEAGEWTRIEATYETFIEQFVLPQNYWKNNF